MKKQIILTLALAVTLFSFGQKKEFKTVEKAIKNLNYAEASNALKLIEPMLESLDDKLKDKYHYLNAVTLFADGKGEFGEMTQAEKSLEKVTYTYQKEVSDLKFKMVGDYLKKANKNYENKKYKPASLFFEKSYNLNKKDTVYLYYAAATAVTVPDYERALKLYNKLKELDYDGSEKQLYAVNVKTGQKESFPSQQLRSVAIKTKTHKDPTVEKTASKRAEIVKNVALIYISNGDNDKAISAIKDARALAPDDVNLLLSEANIYYKMGDTEKFKELLEIATQKDPENAELQYNLGVISAESDHPDEAMAYYKKALELDPNYINAHINCAALVLGKEASIIEEMNGLGSSAKDDKRYDELRAKRQDLYRQAIPFLEKALGIDANNSSAASTLMNIYSVLGETDKYKDMKAKVEALDSGN